jgi:hypothetical protein
MARAASTIICARGQSAVTFDMRAGPPDEAELLQHMLGPTGNLRAPTIQIGTTLIVGFNRDAYARVLGG